MDSIERAPLISELPDIVISTPPLDDLARAWPVLEPILKRATDRVRGYEPIDLLQLVILGRMTMFVIRDHGRIVAAVVTEMRQFPRCRNLEIHFIAGTGLKHWWRPLLDVLDAHAEALGCVDLVGFDRRGWSRFGFKEIGAVMLRRLKD